MQQATENGSSWSFSIGDGCRPLSTGRGEGSLGGLFARVLLPLLHLLDKGFRFFFVGERQSGRTIFKFEGMEEGSILIISKIIVDLLVTDHALVHGLP